MSNCTALEIVDDQYRLITSDASSYGIEAYGIKSYWENNEYLEEKLDTTSEFKPLKELITKILIKNMLSNNDVDIILYLLE